MAKINLTKGHLTELEKASVLIKKVMRDAKGKERAEIKNTLLAINDILIRHDNRLEKEY